jgi:hypothetical protein
MMTLAWECSGGITPEQGRNSIIEKYFKSMPNANNYLFVDDDIVPQTIQAIWELYAAGKDVIAGCCPIRTAEHGDTMNVRLGDNWLKRSELPDSPFRADEVGAGFLLVQTNVLKAIRWPWFKTEFQPADAAGRVIKEGEDEFFCRRAKEEGFEIWAHPKVICDHWKAGIKLSGGESPADSTGIKTQGASSPGGTT